MKEGNNRRRQRQKGRGRKFRRSVEVVCAPVISSPSALDGLSLNFQPSFFLFHISPFYHYITKCSLQVCAILFFILFCSFELSAANISFPSGQEQLSKEEIKVSLNASYAQTPTLY